MFKLIFLLSILSLCGCGGGFQTVYSGGIVTTQTNPEGDSHNYYCSEIVVDDYTVTCYIRQ